MDENENSGMQMAELMQPHNLEKYSFYWLIASLALTVISLLMGGSPIAMTVFGYGALVSLLLKISWILSGAAGGYLLYRWYTAERTLFGEKRNQDLAAFMVATITGVNIGIYGIIQQNILMMMFMASIFNTIGAVLYVVVVIYLWRRWQESGGNLFNDAKPDAKVEETQQEERVDSDSEE